VTYLDKKTWRIGRVVMGDLPRKKDGLIVMGDLSKWKKERVRAQKHTRKEVGLENAIPEKWWLKAHTKGSEGSKAHSK
jgi:hypothetical protein